MKTPLIRSIQSFIILTALAFTAINPAISAEPSEHQPRPGHRTDHPPKEAFTACKDVNEGDYCEVDTPHGLLSGLCLSKGNQIFCVPDELRFHPNKGDRD